MRIAPLFGLFAFAILVTAILGVLQPDQAPALSVEAIREPVPISTTSITATPAFDAHEVVRAPDVDSLGVAVGDLGVTTTTEKPADTAAAKTSSPPAPSTTASGAVSSPATTTPPEPEREAGPNGEFESQFASKINGLRADSGLAKLSRDGSLDARARDWAERMADNGDLSHSDLGSLVPPWTAAGENVGMGDSVKSVFGALVGSSGHKSNMLGDYTHFGIGVWVDSNGTIWTAHVFTR
ncbi:MAG: CAP domain-containing protein [Acidimicrobiia bacterium]